jgi:hypothetical protein
VSESKPRSDGGSAAPGPERASDAGRAARDASVCPVAFCPICTAVSVASRSGPEVVQHLLLAGQQFLLALRAAVDARADDIDEGDPDERPGMQHIDIG